MSPLTDVFMLFNDFFLAASFFSVAQVIRKEGAKGLSLQSLVLLIMTRLAHPLAYPLSLHYWPSVFPWFLFYAGDVASVALAVYIAFQAWTRPGLFDEAGDSFGKALAGKLYKKITGRDVEMETDAKKRFAEHFYWLPFTLLLSAGWGLMRQRLSALRWYQTAFCAFYEVTGPLTLFPQLYMLHKTKKATMQLAYFLMYNAAQRTMTMIFWLFFPLITSRPSPDNRNIQVIIELVNMLILGDFVMCFVRSRMRGEKEVLLTDITSLV